jgi:hypothetical protein
MVFFSSTFNDQYMLAMLMFIPQELWDKLEGGLLFKLQLILKFTCTFILTTDTPDHLDIILGVLAFALVVLLILLIIISIIAVVWCKNKKSKQKVDPAILIKVKQAPATVPAPLLPAPVPAPAPAPAPDGDFDDIRQHPPTTPP